jgi:hypothetical protein
VVISSKWDADFVEVHVSFDQVLMKTRHATTSKGEGGMPKATWSQSSERYYQHRLKLHLINWMIFLSDCVSEDIQEICTVWPIVL